MIPTINLDELSLLIGFLLGFLFSFVGYFFINAIYNEREKKLNNRLTKFMEENKIK